MNKKDLERLGLTAETIEKAGLEPDVLEQIIILHGKDIEKHKTALAEAATQVDSLKSQLVEAGTTVESLKKLDPEGLAKAVDDWKAKAVQAQADAKTQVEKLKYDQVLSAELKAAKVKDPADVIPHLKHDMLKLGEDGKIIGLKEQLEPLQEAKSYLFDTGVPIPKIITGGHNQTVFSDSVVSAARKAAGLQGQKE